MKILLVVGARPNFVKIGPIVEELNRRGVQNVLVHTGQHYDDIMSNTFFEDLGLPAPDINLGVGSGSHAWQTAQIMMHFEQILNKEKPDAIVVVGDVNSTLACSIVASKIDCRDREWKIGANSIGRPILCHVEAGLRSFDRGMPEEVNRVVTDALSDILFVTEESGRINLLKEGKQESQIHFVGNVMIDSLVKHKSMAEPRIDEFPTLKGMKYGLVTLHRPSNVDQKEILMGIMDGLIELSKRAPILFPVHPRTAKHMEYLDLRNRLQFIHERSDLKCQPGVYVMSPLRYLDFLALMMRASVVFTDSGGIQEETTFLGIPCVTIRENTERPATVTVGTNVIVGTKPEKIIEAGTKALDGTWKKATIPKFWDGNTARRIVDVLIDLED